MVTGLAAMSLVACSSDDSGSEAGATTTVAAAPSTSTAVSTPSDPDDPVCVELQRVKTRAAELAQITNPLLEDLLAQGADANQEEVLAYFDRAGDELEAALPELLDTYADAAAVAEPSIAADIRLVADGTSALVPKLVEFFRGADAFEDVADMKPVFSDPEVQRAGLEAGEASLRLDEFTNPTCGFRFSNA